MQQNGSMPRENRILNFAVTLSLLLLAAVCCFRASSLVGPVDRQQPSPEDLQAKQDAELAKLIHIDIKVPRRHWADPGFFVVPGSHVDVIHTLRDEKGKENTTKLPNVLVLALPDLGCNWDEMKGLVPPRPLTVTLGATPDQVTKLTEMKKTGSFKLVEVNPPPIRPGPLPPPPPPLPTVDE
jgi:hypothetical protein